MEKLKFKLYNNGKARQIFDDGSLGCKIGIKNALNLAMKRTKMMNGWTRKLNK